MDKPRILCAKKNKFEKWFMSVFRRSCEFSISSMRFTTKHATHKGRCSSRCFKWITNDWPPKKYIISLSLNLSSVSLHSMRPTPTCSSLVSHSHTNALYFDLREGEGERVGEIAHHCYSFKSLVLYRTAPRSHHTLSLFIDTYWNAMNVIRKHKF